MNITVKLMGAIDVIAAILLIITFPVIWVQIIAWLLLLKGIMSLLS